MLSRGIRLMRRSNFLKSNRLCVATPKACAHGTWVYRTPPVSPPKYIIVIADCVSGVMWWWVLWHLWTQFDHITGEFIYPDASKWTDEELGIPSSVCKCT